MQISSIKLLNPTGKDLQSNEWDYFVAAMRYKDTPIFYPMQILGSVLLFFLS